MDHPFLKKILNYEEKINERYHTKRNEFIEKIKNTKVDNLTNDQLVTFTHNIKSVMDPLLSSIDCMDSFSENETFFKPEYNNFILFYLLFGDFFFPPRTKELESELEPLLLASNIAGTGTATCLKQVLTYNGEIYLRIGISAELNIYCSVYVLIIS